jgi:hypothetical protein
MPIAYYNKTLRDSPLNYDIMEKQTYALVKSLKEFRIYILHSHVVAYVPNNYVKDILTQSDPEEKRGKCIVVLLEYDLDINPTKLIKGQGLAKLMMQCWQPIIFLIALKKTLPTPLVSLMTNHCRIVLLDICLIF